MGREGGREGGGEGRGGEGRRSPFYSTLKEWCEVVSTDWLL